MQAENEIIELARLYPILAELRNTSSTNAKRELLQQHKDNASLRLFFYYGLHGDVNFWLTPTKPTGTDSHEFIETRQLQRLIDREITGDAARAYYQDLIDALTLHPTGCLLHHLVHCLAACWIERVRICAEAHHYGTDKRIS